MAEVTKEKSQESAAAMDGVSRTAENMAQRLGESARAGSMMFSNAMTTVVDDAMRAQQAMANLDMDMHHSPSINDRIAMSLVNTVGLYARGFGEIQALSEATREILGTKLSANADIAANQITSDALSGNFGTAVQNVVGAIEPVEARPSPAAGITNPFGKQVGDVSINVDTMNVEKTADVELFMNEVARRFQLKMISTGG
jgi:hypothetical protein